MAKEIQQEKNTSVAEAVSKTEIFFSSNKKAILTVVAVLIVACAGVFLYHKFGYAPARQEALGQMFPAEANFRNGEYELALNGGRQRARLRTDNRPVRRKGWKGGISLCRHLRAGARELERGPSATFPPTRARTKIMKARATACIGDAYTGLNDYAKAVKYFEKAAAVEDNVFAATYLLKAGAAYEALGDFGKGCRSLQDYKGGLPYGNGGHGDRQVHLESRNIS